MTELGLLPDLTHAILRQVLRDLADWRQAGLDPGRVSVNVPLVVFATESGREELDWLLAQHPGSEPFLAFEITEDVYVARSGDIIAASIRHFRAQGIEIHLDDFGTGQASYQHLRHLTPDVLKIDGSLVSEMGTEAPAEVVIAGFILIAAGIGARVVAEHVETETQRSNLAALGCDYVEGQIFAPAMPVDDAAELMRAPIISATGS
jgi:EAL domain-containing protein (putative c-di-GMP-specific phosphodiesterase class I)